MPFNIQLLGSRLVPKTIILLRYACEKYAIINGNAHPQDFYDKCNISILQYSLLQGNLF
jgi:hypothetical protein